MESESLSALCNGILWKFNLHKTIVDKDDKRKYTGMDAVAEAIEDGATETCSTIHVVTAEVDVRVLFVYTFH